MCYSQKETNIWYFGDKAGLDFNSGEPVELSDGQLFALEGCATISDKNGQLLFYTNGKVVYNRTHDTMSNGIGLMGNGTSSQEAIIIPKPLNDSIYYIFTTPGAFIYTGNDTGIYYSVVNMHLNGGLGAIIPGRKNIFLHKPICEKLTAVHHANGRDIWVVCHEFSSNRFLAYLVKDTGLVETPIFSSSGSVYTSLLQGVGCMKLSPKGTKLASALSWYGNPGIELHDFDNNTGIVSSGFALKSGIPFYGIEFSPDASKLYASSIGLSTILIQYDLFETSKEAIIASEKIITTSNYSKGSLQLAPNGKVYQVVHKKIDSPSVVNLTVIDFPNLLGEASAFSDSVLHFTFGQPYLGLPPAIQSTLFKNDLYVIGKCYPDTTYFFLNSYSTVDSVKWFFSDSFGFPGNSSDLLKPYHIFSDQGIYDVVAIVYDKVLGVDTIKRLIEIGTGISPIPVINKSICKGDSALIALNTDYNYQWIPNDYSIINCDTCSNVVIKTFNDTTFKLIISDSLEICYDSGYVSIRVDTISPINFPADTQICTGDSLFLNVNYPPSATFNWSTTDTVSYTYLSKDSVYFLEVTDGECFVADTIKINYFPINVIPKFSDTSLCLGNSIRINITSKYSFNYQWDDGVIGADRIINDTGVYFLKIIDSNNCSYDDSIVVQSICNPFVTIPNAFSPNEDGINDHFSIIYHDIEKIQKRIYDRWGKIVYDNKDLLDEWNGSHNGKILETGMYLYEITATTFNKHELKYFGKVFLLK